MQRFRVALGTFACVIVTAGIGMTGTAWATTSGGVMTPPSMKRPTAAEPGGPKTIHGLSRHHVCRIEQHPPLPGHLLPMWVVGLQTPFHKAAPAQVAINC